MRCVFAIPGDLATPTGGYTYAREVIPRLNAYLPTEAVALPPGFPFPSAGEIASSADVLKAQDRPDTIFLIDGLAFGAMPDALLAALRAPIVALVHHPLGLEEGLPDDTKRRLLESEGRALRFAKAAVVPSPATAAALNSLFGVAEHAITIAEPGVLRGVRAVIPDTGAHHIVSVAAITPRKDFGTLMDALGQLSDLRWRLTIAGALDRSPEAVAELRDKIEHYAFQNRVALFGPVSQPEVSALYSSGHIFALASTYEGYGMAFAEAMAHGLPVVASGEGAVRDTVPLEAGFVCPVGDAHAIAAAIRALLTDRSLCAEKANAAWSFGQGLPKWEDTARMIAGALRRVLE